MSAHASKHQNWKTLYTLQINLPQFKWCQIKKLYSKQKLPHQKILATMEKEFANSIARSIMLEWSRFEWQFCSGKYGAVNLISIPWISIFLFKFIALSAANFSIFLSNSVRCMCIYFTLLMYRRNLDQLSPKCSVCCFVVIEHSKTGSHSPVIRNKFVSNKFCSSRLTYFTKDNIFAVCEFEIKK